VACVELGTGGGGESQQLFVREQKREILRREREREEEGLFVICKILEACVWAAFFFAFFSFLAWNGTRIVRGLWFL
jgi:hypothetical protein